MKKWIFLALTFAAALPCHTALSADGVIVTNVQGGPEIIRGGMTMPAVVGASCQKDDVIKTSPGCMLDVSVNGLAGCRLLESSECSLTTVEKNSMQLDVIQGNVVLNLAKLPGESVFRLETPTAVASVRGTQFWGRVDTKQAGNPVTTFAVREGKVDILDKVSNRSFNLEKGWALDIPKDSSAAPSVRAALAGEMQAMEQADVIKITA